MMRVCMVRERGLENPLQTSIFLNLCILSALKLKFYITKFPKFLANFVNLYANFQIPCPA